MSRPAYLLDTNILLALARGGEVARRLDRTYGLRAPGPTPLVCVVSEAELKVLADRNGWSAKRVAQIDDMFEELVVIDHRGHQRSSTRMSRSRGPRAARRRARAS